MEWLSVKEKKPDFGVQVFTWCPIYGRCVRKYQETGDSGSGDWTDAITGQRGGLPPKYWQEIIFPQPPEDKL